MLKIGNFDDRKHLILALSGVVIAVLSVGILVTAASFSFTESIDSDSGKERVEWQETELQDVNSGENFTVSELEKPVLVESFAVWCSTCTRQQQEIKKLHEKTDVRSVSLNVDTNEDEKKIQQHTSRYGFDWRYAVSPSSMTRQLVNQYGNSIAHPPSAPVVLVCDNSTRKLPNGVKPVSKLQEEIEKGC